MKSSFFNSVNYDRTYSSKDWAEYFKQFIGNGVYAEPDTGMQVVSDGGMNIKCLDGSCFINGYTGTASSTEDKRTLAIGNGMYDRIDAIVARLDLNERDIHIDVIQGVPSVTPAKPKHVRTKMVHDLVLAYVTVKAKAMSISDANIEDVRPNEAVCGFVKGVVEQIQTGELFKQYSKEWELLMAGVELNEPAIIAAFNALNSVRSINGIFPIDGNILIPQLKVVTGAYAGNGAVYADTIDYSDYPLFSHAVLPVIYPQTLTEDQASINIGATPSVVMIAEITDGNIDAEKQYIITGNSKYFGPWVKTDVKNSQECYVVQKDGAKFDGTENECITKEQYKYTPYRYSFYLDNNATGELVSPEYLTKLIVVSDDVTPTSNQIRRSDLQDKLLINELIGVDESGNPNGIEGVEKKHVDDVVIGQTVYKAILTQRHYYKYQTTSKIAENGFITNFNTAGHVYSYIAFAESTETSGGGSAITNPNLLINPDLKINQRGQTEYTSGGYTVDMWCHEMLPENVTSTVTIHDDYTTIAQKRISGDWIWNTLMHVIDVDVVKRLRGQTLTFSVMHRGAGLTQLYASNNLNGTSIGNETFPNTPEWKLDKITFVVPNDANYLSVRIYADVTGSNGYTDIKWAKLELGSVATQFVPPDPATELIKCQRYYQIRSTGDISPVDLRPSMRITPTVTQLDNGNYAYNAEI